MSKRWVALLVNMDGSTSQMSLREGFRPPFIEVALPTCDWPPGQSVDIESMMMATPQPSESTRRKYEHTGGPLRLYRGAPVWVFVYEEAPC